MANGRVMDAARQEGARKMTLIERQNTEKELREIESQLKGDAPATQGDGRRNPATDPTESRPDLLQNKPALLAKKRKLEEALNKDDDLIAVGPRRAALSAEAKALEDVLGPHMLTERERGERMTVNRQQDYNQAVEKTIAQQRGYLPKLQRWQEIMRQLYPDDPTMCDVKRIKPR